MKFRINGGDVKSIAVTPIPADAPLIIDTLVVIKTAIDDLNIPNLLFTYKIVHSEIEGGGEEVVFSFGGTGIEKIELCKWSLGFNETLGLTTLTEVDFSDGTCDNSDENLIPMTLFSKVPRYQLQLKNPSLRANAHLSGEVTASAAVAGLVDVEAMLSASQNATVELSTVSSEWQSIEDVLKKVGSGNVSDVFLASVAFNGEVSAVIQVGEPFDTLIPGPISATGQISTSIANLFAPSIDIPQFELSVDLPAFGNLLDNLSFSDIIGMLRLGLESLIGPADASLLTPNPANLRHRRRRSLRVEDERLETCDAGILGSPIFGYEFPVIGVSVCNLVSKLSGLSESIDQLCAELKCDDPTAHATGTFDFVAKKLDEYLRFYIPELKDIEGQLINIVVDNNQLRYDIDLVYEFNLESSLQVDLAQILKDQDFGPISTIAEFFLKVLEIEANAKAGVSARIELHLGLAAGFDNGVKLSIVKRDKPLFAIGFDAFVEGNFTAKLGPVAAEVLVDLSAENLAINVTLKK